MKEQYEKDWVQMRAAMPAPFSISDTYEVFHHYLVGPGSNHCICIKAVRRYFNVPQEGSYVHFRVYLTAQPGTVRVGLEDDQRIMRIGEGDEATSQGLLPAAHYALMAHFTMAKAQVLYVELCEGPFDKDCNTLPESVQYPHIEDPVRI